MDHTPTRLAERLVQVSGIVGVTLGGSRARGDHTPESDHDLGLYYEPPIDLAALGELARELAGPSARVTAPGEWGPWVDGGGWLTIGEAKVDWIYRDLGRVRTCRREAEQGRYRFHVQAGHPLGFPDFAYPAELALGVVLADPTGRLAELREHTRRYPARLSDALVAGLWEAGFLVDVARKAVGRGDTTYIAGCLFRAVGVCAHALHGRAGRWVVNEKGLVASAGRLPLAPNNFAGRAHSVLGGLGTGPDELRSAIDAAAKLVTETTVACQACRADDG